MVDGNVDAQRREINEYLNTHAKRNDHENMFKINLEIQFTSK